MAEVVLEHVTKVFPGGVTAVSDLCLRIADGELVTVVGPSGCGKTTTLRMLAGLEKPTAGTIRIGGRVVNDLPPRQRDLAMVFQKHGLYPHLTVRDNLAFGFRLRHDSGWPRWLLPGRSAQRRQQQRVLNQRLLEVAELLGLETVLERYPAQLSGGQRQRVAVGRLLVRQPTVFLFDEPFSDLDPPLRAELRRELHLLHRRLHATMLYVTHDQVEAMTLGQRVVVLDRGVVQQVDEPVAIYDRPCNRFVAGFIGWPPMNFFHGRLVRENGRCRFQAGKGGLDLPLDATGGCPPDDQPMVLGIRPEHLGVWREGPGQVKLSMEVVLVETLGGDCLVSLQRDDWRATARWARDVPCQPGQVVVVGFDMRRVHWFDGGNGRAWNSPSIPVVHFTQA